MPELTITDLPDDVYERLHIRAIANNRSIDEEVCDVIVRALGTTALSVIERGKVQAKD